MRLVYVLIGWAAGIAAAADWATLSAPGWAVLGTIAAGAVLLTWHTPGYRLLNIMLLAFTLGGLRYSLLPISSDIAQYNNIGGMTIEGIVIAEPDIRDDRILLRVRAETVTRAGQVKSTSGLVMVRAPHTSRARYGDRVAVTGLLFTPAAYDRFSYADYLARSGIYSVMENTVVTVLSSGHGSPVRSALIDLRHRAASAIARNLPEPQAGLLTGILTGNERGISPELQAAFAATGAAHIIAISGFSMIIVAGVVMALLKHTRLSKVWSACIGIGAVLIYAIFAGANAAVLRAALMSAVLIIGQTIDRRTYVPASLAFITLLMSAAHPAVLWDVGFQLSFFAVLGLALFAEPITRYINRLLAWMLPAPAAVRTGSLLQEPLVVTLAVQITSLPIILLHFGRLSVVTLPVNLLILPVQAHLLITGGLATLLAWLSPIAQILYWIDIVLLSWSIAVVRWFAALPFADVQIFMNAHIIALYFVVLIGWSMINATQPDWWYRFSRFVQQRAVISTLAFAGFVLIMLMGAVAISRPDGQLHVWFLDVGHTNAVLVQTPGGAQVLVDGGRYPSRLLTALGDRMPFHDRTIEVLVISQPDDLDTGALPAVLARYQTGVVLLNGQPNLSDGALALEEALLNRQTIIATAGHTVEFSDGTMLEILHPQQTPSLVDPLNEHPLVLRLRYGKMAFLITGDLSADGQRALLASDTWPLASVMQLPQHGTAQSLSMEFLEAVQPRIVVVQADRANRRSDPDPDILALLPAGIRVFSTLEEGTLHLWTNGEQLWTDCTGNLQP